MPSTFVQRIGAAFGDRKAQVGAVAGLSLIALGGVGVIAITAAARAEPVSPEMAERARLAIVMQPIRENQAMEPRGRLATLDPDQENRSREVAYPQPVDPELQALLRQQAREDAQVQAEQRAFDARLKAELAGDAPSGEDAPREPPQPRYTTSNSEDTPLP